MDGKSSKTHPCSGTAWDTADLRSPSVSDGGTIVLDLPGRCLRRALDQKVRNLRTMLLNDEDITTELDKVVCRLMKLALHSSKGRETPPPARWMQCKLLDLLTLTEKAISRRKKCIIEGIPLKPDKQPVLLEQDTRVKELVKKYRHLIQPLAEKMTNTDNNFITDVDIEDEFLSTTSNEFGKENDFAVEMSPSLVIPQPVFSMETFEIPDSTLDANPLERTKAWLAEDPVCLELEPYLKHEIKYEDISSGDTDHSVSKVRHKHKKSIKKHKTSNKVLTRVSATDPSSRTQASQSRTSCKFKIKREYRKNSKTQVTKKVSRKKSNCTNMVAIPGAYSSTEYDNYEVGSTTQGYPLQTLNVAASKPIPESLMALCHPDLKVEKGTDPLKVTDSINVENIPSCISATEGSLHIGIITQDYEETIALRRNIGTDTKVAPKDAKAELEVQRKRDVGNMSIDFDNEIYTKHQVSTENVQSQTIFLNDINEPSTSKGIRHNISTDVQCGPDNFASYPQLSPQTSVKMSQVFSTSVKLNDVGADGNVKGTDFGTSTQDTNNFKTITPRWRPVGIKIKDSDINLRNHIECSTMTIPESMPQMFATARSSTVQSAVSSHGTKLLKPISSSLKLEDSGSEFCAPSMASTSKTRIYCMTESKTTSNVLMKCFESKGVVSRIESPSQTLNLTCGAVHVHSYRDERVSEDVVYQGEWQRYKPNSNTRKKPLNFSTSRKAIEAVARKPKDNLKEKKVNSKEKIYRKRLEKKLEKKQEKKEMVVEPKKPQIRNVKLRKVTQEEKCVEVKKPRVSKSAAKLLTKPKNIPRPIKTTTKVASKHAISANTSKNSKSTFTIKRSAVLVNVNVKKENEKQQKAKKSYIPLYLKKTLDKDKLNKSLDSASDAMNNSINKLVKKITPLVRSNTEEIRKDLLKLTDDLHVNISYVVCRNDKEDKIISPEEQTSENSKDYNKSAPKQLDIQDKIKRSQSPSHSMNSSTCSSPNSVATVRAVSTRPKTTTKRHSTQPCKVNATNSESDNPSPPKAKKVVKRYKYPKKTDNKDIGNKENIPESTKNFVNKDKEKIIKSPFIGRPKSVCVAQVKIECSSPPLARQNAQISNKSNVKILSRRDSVERRKSISPSVSKKRSLKSNTSLIYDDFIQSESESYKSFDSTNMVLVLEPQQNYEDLSKARIISRKPSTELAVKSNHNLMEQLEQESSVHSSATYIQDSIRQLLEETLDRIIPSNRNIRHLSAHTVTLSKDDDQKDNAERVKSPEIKKSLGLVETDQSDTENALNRTFDTLLGDESTFCLNDTGLTIADLDLLSFKSITSDSKYSEYYLADNEFNTSQEIDQVHTQNTNSVHDIFERKEPHLIQTTPGPLAIQAFSGFSLDAAPVAGDQPDPIAPIDSETGSMAVEFNRQVTSEELFVSGRSSESYDSCILDDDTVVPNWLFQLISQQHNVDEEHQAVILGPVAAPLADPMYDANGNLIEPALLGVGAGAGDGRGMHSDHSQDSSGRGTSLSSSDTSSGPQSEVSTVLMDPSAQFELLRDPMTSSAVVTNDHHQDNSGTLRIPREDRMRTTHGPSDIDADISSIDTDAPDLSDN